jgi:Uncharacterised nucleotidyltransferase
MMTPEDQFVLLLARGKLFSRVREQARALLEKPLDWDVILERVTAEEVYPLFTRNLETLGFAGVGKQGAGSKEQGANGELRIANCEIGESPVAGPPSVRERLGGLVKINAFRNTLLTEELVRVLKLLADRGIPTIPLKGVTLAQSLYGDPALRACVDLDILVPRSMVARAFNLLRAQGYVSEFAPGFFANLLLRHDIEYALRREERGFHYMVELHWGILWGGRSEAGVTDQLWADAYPMTVFGAPAYALSPEWQILFLAAHAARHKWQGLKWLVDLHELYSSADIDWDKLNQKAKQLGWEEVLRISLHACHALFDTAIPANFSLGELPPWVKLFPVAAPASLSGAFFATRFLTRTSDKLRYAARVFLVPTLAEWRLISLPSFLGFLYYPLRPLRLGCKWSGAFLRGGLDKLGLSTSN